MFKWWLGLTLANLTIATWVSLKFGWVHSSVLADPVSLAILVTLAGTFNALALRRAN